MRKGKYQKTVKPLPESSGSRILAAVSQAFFLQTYHYVFSSGGLTKEKVDNADTIERFISPYIGNGIAHKF